MSLSTLQNDTRMVGGYNYLPINITHDHILVAYILYKEFFYN